MSSPEWQDLLIPGTDVLRNLHNRSPAQPYGTADPGLLAHLENHFAMLRLWELDVTPLAGPLDYTYMQRIHGYIFRDTYEWAGQQREVPWDGPMSKVGPAVVKGDPERVPYYYLSAREIGAAAGAAYADLAKDNYLTGRRRRDFVDGLARHWGRINQIHSFREGNTRSQFAFFRTLCADAGWTLDTTKFGAGPLRDEFVAARFFYQRSGGDHSRLAAALNQGISAPEITGNRAQRLLDVALQRERPAVDVQSRFSPAHHVPAVQTEPFRGSAPEAGIS